MEARVDGRTARGERTRTAIIESLLALLEAGELQPSLAEVAARAGVSDRSVFQHFGDREALFAALSVRQVERVTAVMRPLDAARPFPERLEAFVRQRAEVLELITPVRRAALLVEPTSERVRGALDHFRALKRGQVAATFRSELRAAGAERATLTAALGAVCSFSAWEALRVHQGLSPGRAGAALRLMIERLLAPHVDDAEDEGDRGPDG